MKINRTWKTVWIRWLPVAVIVVTLVGGTWQLVVAVGRIFDGPLTQDSIIAQEERLNAQGFVAFEALQEAVGSLAPIPSDLKDPFRP